MGFPIQKTLAEVQETFRSARCDYNAAKKGRFRRTRAGVTGVPRSADYHYYRERDFLFAMETARDIDRNDLVVGQGIDRFVDNVVGDGYSLDTQTGDQVLDDELKARWEAWSQAAEQCDRSAEHDFPSMERFICREAVVDGDIFPVLMREGCIDLIEAHRVRTPANCTRNTKVTAIHGVELGPDRKRRRLWVTKDDIDPTAPCTRASEVERLPFHDPKTGERVVLQYYRPRRKSQTRGFTCLAPIVDAAGMHDDVQFATLVQRQIVSCFAILREMSPGVTMPSREPGATGETTQDHAAYGGVRTLENIGPGMDIEGRPGEKLTSFSPNIPNPEFFPHAMMVLTFIAINLGLPVAVLLLDPSNTNFSGWRGAIDQARLGFRRHQRNMIRRFHRPVYLWKVGQWIAEDRAFRRLAEAGKVDPFRHQWYPPAWEYIEPHKDAASDLLQTRNSMTSRRRICARRGYGDWDDLAREIVEDNAALAVAAWEKAEQLNTSYPGINIGWRELAYTPTPDGVTVKMPLGEDGGDEGRGSEEEGRDVGDEGRGTGDEE